MRLLKKLVMKCVTLVVMAVLLGGAMRVARPYIMKAAGVPSGIPGVDGSESLEKAQFSTEESDLMATVFKSAIRLFTGQAKREELAGELSDKLYGGQMDASTRAELGIELVKPGGESAIPGTSTPAAAAGLPVAIHEAQPAAGTVAVRPQAAAGRNNAQLIGKVLTQAGTAAVSAKESVPQTTAEQLREVLLGRILAKAKANPELSMIPLVLFGMVVVHRVRRRRSPEDAFMLPDLAAQMPSDTEPYDMKHAVHSLKAEDFELLVALIYQRQGYRVTMPAGSSGGRGGDFTLARKSENLLVQCKRHNSDHKIPVERVRELQSAAAAAGATRAMYVATCSFSWDARNFAKTKGVTLINARTLDALLTAARENPDEDLLAVANWAPKLMGRVKLTPPLCPACEASMDQLSVSTGSVWVCSQRPDCKGRRPARNMHKPASAPAPAAPAREQGVDAVSASI